MTRIVEQGEGERLGRAVVALGVFDGVHVGHQALVRDAVAMARHGGAQAVVVTFDRDPDRVVSPASAAPQLLPLPDKLELLASLHPDVVLVVPFDERLAGMSPEGFVDDVLLPSLVPVTVVVGNDFRFGASASGDVSTLQRLGLAHGFSVAAHELVAADGLPVTSTRIRALVASGQVEHAAELLGRPHRLTGEVVAGRGDGRRIGFPTANLVPPSESAVPGHGVYVGVVFRGTESHPAAIAVGRAPSFPDAAEVVEAHLLGFDGDLNGECLRVDFLEKLRDMRPFASSDELAEAIAEDVAAVRSAFSEQ